MSARLRVCTCAKGSTSGGGSGRGGQGVVVVVGVGGKVKTTEQRADFLRESSLCGDPNEDSRGAPGAAPSCVPDTVLVLRPAS